MARPPFSVVVPTLGRSTLRRTLESIRSQAIKSEVIVVADTYEMAPELIAWVGGVADEYGALAYSLDAGAHDAGSPQLDLGYQLATGQFVMNLGDDDVYVPGAFEAIARGLTDRPMLFLVELHPNEQRGNTRPVMLWDAPIIERFHVTGQSFVTPNLKHLMGRWVDDVTFIRETVALHGGQVAWREEVIARCY